MPTRKYGRFEILLPTAYNDGASVEEDRFELTRPELDEQFGASSVDLVPVSGHWKYQGTRYIDILRRFWTDAPDTRATRRFFKRFKSIRKDRFQQEDIWMTVQQIEIIRL
jgi:hypothetical protein